MQEAARLAAHGSALLWFEPVSSAKATRATHILDKLDFVSPNAAELVAMASAVRGKELAALGEVQSVEAEIQRLLPHADVLLQVNTLFPNPDLSDIMPQLK